MNKTLIIGALFIGYYNQLFTAYAPLDNALTIINKGPREEVLNFLSLLDTAVKTRGCASMEVLVDNQKAACGPMLAAIIDKINKSQLLSSDEVEYGYAIADGLVNVYMPYFYSKKESERTEEYTQLHQLCQQLNVQTLTNKKCELLYQFEKPASEYAGKEIMRSPSVKVVNFLKQTMSKHKHTSKICVTFQGSEFSAITFCDKFSHFISKEDEPADEEVSLFVRLYDTTLKYFQDLSIDKNSKKEDTEIYLSLLDRKHLLEQFKQANSK